MQDSGTVIAFARVSRLCPHSSPSMFYYLPVALGVPSLSHPFATVLPCFWGWFLSPSLLTRAVAPVRSRLRSPLLIGNDNHSRYCVNGSESFSLAADTKPRCEPRAKSPSARNRWRIHPPTSTGTLTSVSYRTASKPINRAISRT